MAPSPPTASSSLDLLSSLAHAAVSFRWPSPWPFHAVLADLVLILTCASTAPPPSDLHHAHLRRSYHFEPYPYHRADLRLPDNIFTAPNPAQALAAFCRRLFNYDQPEGDSYFIEMRVVQGAIALMILAGGAALLRRMIRGTFWVIKLTHRPEGTYIMPNAVILFVLVIGAFGIIWIAYSSVNLQVHGHDAPAWGQALWITLIWLPLYFAAFWGGWGTLYTVPSLIMRSERHQPSEGEGVSVSPRFLKRLPRPIVINIFAFATPFIMSASLLVPATIANTAHDGAYADFLSLQADLANATTITIGQQDRAVDIWAQVAHAYWYISLTFLLWSVWACLLLAFYTPASLYLMTILRRKLRQFSGPESEDGWVFPRPGEQTADYNTALAQEPSPAVTDRNMTSFFTVEARKKSFFSLTRRKPGGKRRLSAPTQGPVVGGGGGGAAAGTREGARYKYIRKVLISFAIQSTSITLGIIGFSVIAAQVSVEIYQRAEQNDIGKICGEANLSAAWLIILAGGVSVGAIVSRTFEVLETDPFSDNPPQQRNKRRSHASAPDHRSSSISIFFQGLTGGVRDRRPSTTGSWQMLNDPRHTAGIAGLRFDGGRPKGPGDGATPDGTEDAASTAWGDLVSNPESGTINTLIGGKSSRPTSTKTTGLHYTYDLVDNPPRHSESHSHFSSPVHPSSPSTIPLPTTPATAYTSPPHSPLASSMSTTPTPATTTPSPAAPWAFSPVEQQQQQPLDECQAFAYSPTWYAHAHAHAHAPPESAHKRTSSRKAVITVSPPPPARARAWMRSAASSTDTA